MKLLSLTLSLVCLGMVATAAPDAGDLESLKRQLQQANESFEKALQQHRLLIDALQQRIQTLEQQPGRSLPPGITPTGPPPSEPAAAAEPSASPKPWSPTDPIPLLRAGPAYMNVSASALVNFGWSTEPDVAKELNLGHHDPLQRGFSMRNGELSFDGAVDPYFKGYANLVFALDPDQELEIEAEEVYLQTTSLPANLQLKAGQFFAEFGRHNPLHPHAWAFVDQPIILNRAFGPDGLRNVGGQLSWLAPTPFYTEAFLGVLNGQGGQAWSFRNGGEEDDDGIARFHGRETLGRGLRGPGDFLFVPRLATSFDLTSQQTVLAGASAAFGPNDTGQGRRTQIYGVDLYWKWKSPWAQAGFPFVAWQTEALYRRFEAGADPDADLPSETLRDWGLYSQLLWGFKPRWVAALRGEYATGNRGAYDFDDVFRGSRHRVAPGLTWYFTEFSKARLQYNYDWGRRFGTDHSVWLQMEFQLGSHAAHKF